MLYHARYWLLNVYVSSNKFFKSFYWLVIVLHVILIKILVNDRRNNIGVEKYLHKKKIMWLKKYIHLKSLCMTLKIKQNAPRCVHDMAR
jgi:hypothetical protein